MAENTRTSQSQPAEAPGGGRQDHDAMRAASMRPVTGAPNTDALASIGGVNVPGRDPASSARIDVDTVAPAREPIPGERDASTLTHREPGAIGAAFGAGTPSPDTHTWLDEATAHDRMIEGGGDGEHSHHVTEGYVKHGK